MYGNAAVDLRKSIANLAKQLCTKEIAVHATVEMFNDDDTHDILEIDANNAFNSIDR